MTHEEKEAVVFVLGVLAGMISLAESKPEVTVSMRVSELAIAALTLSNLIPEPERSPQMKDLIELLHRRVDQGMRVK